MTEFTQGWRNLDVLLMEIPWRPTKFGGRGVRGHFEVRGFVISGGECRFAYFG
jgi:hypothetical protein